MASFDDPIFVFDTESTGVDPTEARIVELGAAHFEGREFKGPRRALINPGVPIPPDSSEIHGITDDRVMDKPDFAAVAPRFLERLQDDRGEGVAPILVGYNAVAYDVPLINTELARHGMVDAIDANNVLDPIIFVRWSLRHLRRRGLADICAHFGLKLDRAHSAAADAKATGELLFAMIDSGAIPDTPSAAFAEQDRVRPMLEREWDEFTYWLYKDRGEDVLRMGAGAHCGTPLQEVDPSYLEYLLGKVDDLPEAVRAHFERYTG